MPPAGYGPCCDAERVDGMDVYAETDWRVKRDATVIAGQARPHLLIVEDDRDLADLLQVHLGEAGFKVDLAHDGAIGLERALAGGYALVILDVMLPALDGFTVCEQIRVADAAQPVLLLTARAEEEEKVLGLELGADDYMTKPFSLRELTARVRTILRRLEAVRDGSDQILLRYNDLVVDLAKREVTLKERPIDLTRTEFDLLAVFARHPGRAYRRQEILDLVWGKDYTGYSATVNTHINRLRSKIEEDSAAPRFIKTVWGVGYRFARRGELVG